MTPQRRPARAISRRGSACRWLFAVAYSAVGFSIYFALGVVAERGLGLTPLIFLVAGLLFGLTTLTYVEGGAMFRERGGSSTLRPPRLQRADRLHRRLGDPDRLPDRDRARGDLGAALPGADLGGLRRRRDRDLVVAAAVIAVACVAEHHRT